MGVRKTAIGISIFFVFFVGTYEFLKRYDNYKGVEIHTNIYSQNSKKRNLTKDGYNLGLKWQCVEFVKRYYYKKYNHKMPNSYGHAISFYNPSIGNGKLNIERNLYQYKNIKGQKPLEGDIIVLKTSRKYGHVAIVVKATTNYVLVAQQNTILNYQLIKLDQKVVGWLRLK